MEVARLMDPFEKARRDLAQVHQDYAAWEREVHRRNQRWLRRFTVVISVLTLAVIVVVTIYSR